MVCLQTSLSVQWWEQSGTAQEFGRPKANLKSETYYLKFIVRASFYAKFIY